MEPELGAGAGSRNRSQVKVGPAPQHWCCGTGSRRAFLMQIRADPDLDAQRWFQFRIKFFIYLLFHVLLNLDPKH